MFNITAAYGKDFVNREKELKEMLSELKNTGSVIGHAVYGRRRLGKTSLFREIACRLSETRTICPIYFSLWDMTIKDAVFFSKRLTEKILEPYRRHFRIKYATRDLFEGSYKLIKNIIGGLKISAPVGESIEFLLSFDREHRIDLDKLIDEVFKLPEKLAAEAGKKSVLLIDEFPDIVSLKFSGSNIGSDIIGKLRTIHEEYKHTSLNIAGSIRSTMDAVALSPQSAFYRQFVVREIQPFNKDSVGLLMAKNLTGKRFANGAIDEIYKLTMGIPLYVQYFGRILAELGVRHVSVTDCQQARDIFLKQDATILFSNDLDAISEKERHIVIRIAHADGIPLTELSSSIKGVLSNISLYLKRLVNKGIIESRDNSYDIADPLFKEWLRQTTAW